MSESRAALEGDSVVIPASLDAPAEAREWVRGVIRWLPDDRQGDLVLAVSELVANSVVHAGLSAGQGITVEVRRHRDRVVLVVTDGGRGLPDRVPRRPPGVGFAGRGLLLVGRIADRVALAPAEGRVCAVWRR